jgi:peptidoglycan/xylan/chitin deacetylase (PgdA/CDA1 family)
MDVDVTGHHQVRRRMCSGQKRRADANVPHVAALGRALSTLRPVSNATRAFTAKHLRIVAYHDVTDLKALYRQMQYLSATYHPVSGREVVRALSGKVPLRAGAVWVTFDDGFASALAAGEMLHQCGVTATAFVCPGVASGEEQFWWQVLEAWAAAALLSPERTAQIRVALKVLPDTHRRSVIESMRQGLERGQVGSRPATRNEIETWVALGHEVASHSWDHPMLDTCNEAEQERQILLAHEWLTKGGFDPLPVFAYPNGNATDYADRVLRRLGYAHSVLFDMRLTRPLNGQFRLSRLRLDAADSEERARAVLAGSLPLLAHVAGRVHAVAASE